jgi:hypothetical protein
MALVVDHKIRYVRTLEYRNVPAVVQVWIGAVKGASFDIHYLLQDPVTGEDCVKASATWPLSMKPPAGCSASLPNRRSGWPLTGTKPLHRTALHTLDLKRNRTAKGT